MTNAAKVWNKEEIKNLILTNDKMVGKSLVQLWKLQTGNEQEVRQTKLHNNIGFNSADANILSNMAVYFQKNNTLTEKQLYAARKRLVKYANQLTKIANGELSEAQVIPEIQPANDYVSEIKSPAYKTVEKNLIDVTMSCSPKESINYLNSIKNNPLYSDGVTKLVCQNLIASIKKSYPNWESYE